VRAARRGVVVEEDLVKDGWTEIIRNLLVMIRNDDDKDMSFDALQENMELADTEKGVVANGVEYEVDCIIFGTGFEVGTGYSRRCGYETYGRGGVSFTEKWKDGMRTSHGIHSHGFPNLFIMGTNGQSGFTANYPHALNEQSKHIAWIIAQCQQGNHKIVEATEEAGTPGCRPSCNWGA
jgi:cation diffusion facilitator CzcD-associated flavoprotein CzcO